MRRRLTGIVVAVLAAVPLVVGPTTPAEAGSYKWSSAVCSARTLDVRGHYCTQVQYYKRNDGARKVTGVYHWWSRGPVFMYNADNVKVWTGHWRWLGSNIGNYRFIPVRNAPYRHSSWCTVRADLDGWAWFNAYNVRNYNKCW